MSTLRITALIGAGALGLATLAGFATPRESAGVSTEAAAFSIDAVHSSLVFKITHVGLVSFYGRFNEFSGEYSLEDGGSLTMTVKADSVDTGNDRRDGHLRTPDFFNIKQYPEITFKSTKVTSAGDDTFNVTGDLTMLGKTKPVEVEVVKIGEGDRGPQMGYRAGIETTFTIKRSDFGMSYGLDNGGLGDEVTLIVALEGARN